MRILVWWCRRRIPNRQNRQARFCGLTRCQKQVACSPIKDDLVRNRVCRTNYKAHGTRQICPQTACPLTCICLIAPLWRDFSIRTGAIDTEAWWWTQETVINNYESTQNESNQYHNVGRILGLHCRMGRHCVWLNPKWLQIGARNFSRAHLRHVCQTWTKWMNEWTMDVLWISTKRRDRGQAYTSKLRGKVRGLWRVESGAISDCKAFLKAIPLVHLSRLSHHRYIRALIRGVHPCNTNNQEDSVSVLIKLVHLSSGEASSTDCVEGRTRTRESSSRRLDACTLQTKWPITGPRESQVGPKLVTRIFCTQKENLVNWKGPNDKRRAWNGVSNSHMVVWWY